MTAVADTLINDLEARGLIAQMTAEVQLREHLRAPRTLYVGFDPTADSLHIGSLVPLLTLRRFQLAGHTPVALVGGATGLVGDPSFKATERKLNTDDVVAGWTQSLHRQVSRFLAFDGPAAARVVNNLDWTRELTALSFLRDVGKHFSVNNMINKESVKQRLEREGSGISFTEFSYMLLQSLDFAELYNSLDCTLQVGGSDQWGNITGGVDLTRRMHGGQVFGLTLPLVTKADGTKFGKTESGTVWLDAAKTSPYAFYQFWLGTSDADVYKFLKYFTFLSVAEIDELERVDAQASGGPQAQARLAAEVTQLVHGSEALTSAQHITEALFTGKALGLSADQLDQLKLDGVPHTRLDTQVLEGQSLAECLVSAGMVSSGKQVKDALGRGALTVNEQALEQASASNALESLRRITPLHGQFFLTKLGKKTYHLFEWQPE